MTERQQSRRYSLPIWLRVVGWVLVPIAALSGAGTLFPRLVRFNPHTEGLLVLLAIVVGHSLAHLWLGVAALLYALGVRKGAAPEVLPALEYMIITVMVVSADIVVRVGSLGMRLW